MRGLSIEAGFASLAVVAGLGLIIGSHLVGRRKQRGALSSQAVTGSAIPNRPSITPATLHESWSASAPTPPESENPDRVMTKRRAEILAGLQLALLLALLIGGLIYTQAIMADQLPVILRSY